MLSSLRRFCTTSRMCYNKFALYYSSSVLPVAFSTREFPQYQLSPLSNDNNCKGDEADVLCQLYDLFPLSSHKRIAMNLPHVQFEAVDDFLSPEDKLRGVFLQKLSGKTAVYRALSNVAVELDVDLFSKVVNRGNLCGAMMVVFFHWAIEQPKISNDVSTYNIVLKALGRRKFFAHMMALINEMDINGAVPDLRTVSIVMDSFIRAHQVSKAIDAFKELENHGLKFNEEVLDVSLKCLCARKHVSSAWSLFSKMRERVNCGSNTYNTIIGGWATMGRVSEVEKCLKAMVDEGIEPDCVTYSYLLEALGRAGQVDNAVKIFNFLEDKGSELNVVVYNAMIFNFLALGNIDEALKYLQLMQSRGCKANINTYVRITMYFLKVRRVADAIEMFDEILNQGIIPRTGMVTEFLEPLCSYGPPHAALMIYKKARKAGCTISFTAYKLLLMRLSRFGKCGMLLNMWNEMQDSGFSSDIQVYEYIINALCNSGRLEKAVLVMEESLFKGFYPNKLICCKLSNNLIDSNKTKMAYQLFLKLRKAREQENAQHYCRVKGWHF